MRRGLAVLTLAACGSGSGGTVHATAKLLNGPTPVASTHRAIAAPAVPADGTYVLSPNKVRMRLRQISLAPTGPVSGDSMPMLSNCEITVDLAQPTLATLLECPFDLPAASYSNISLDFDESFDVLIDDPVNGFYTDPSSPAKIVTSPPAGGAAFVTMMTQPHGNGSLDTFDKPIKIGGDPPMGVDAGLVSSNELTISVVLASVHEFRVQVQGGQVTTQGILLPPEKAANIGDVARAEYYVRSDYGTALTHAVTNADLGAVGIVVLYAGQQPSVLFPKPAYEATACPIAGMATADSRGLLGLDTSGVLGWASTHDGTWQTMSIDHVFAMPQVTTIGGTTTLACGSVSTSPTPAGGTFASGAPAITSPVFQQSLTLIAR